MTETGVLIKARYTGPKTKLLEEFSMCLTVYKVLKMSVGF